MVREIGDAGRIGEPGRLVGEEPACCRDRGDHQEQDNEHTDHRAHPLGGTGMQKRHLVATGRVAPGPGLRIFELGTAVEPVCWLLALLPLGSIRAECLLQANVLAGLAQPVGEPRPLADQGLVADFQGGGSGDLIGCEQARGNEGISRFSHDGRLLFVGQQQFGQGCTAACRVLLSCSRID